MASVGPRVHAELGVDSMMSLLVYTDRPSFGALSLYCGSGAGSMLTTSP